MFKLLVTVKIFMIATTIVQCMGQSGLASYLHVGRLVVVHSHVLMELHVQLHFAIALLNVLMYAMQQAV